MIRIFADFTNCDEDHRVRLDTVGSLEDIKQYEDVLVEGMVVILYTPDELEVCATLFFDEIWMGIPDWKTIRYY